jgi:hypothetical protein
MTPCASSIPPSRIGGISEVILFIAIFPFVVSKSLANLLRGTHGFGRPHVLTKDEELAVSDHVRETSRLFALVYGRI